MHAEAIPTVIGSASGSRHTSGDSNLQGPSGVLLVDKPTGITSHDVVDVVRRVYRTRSVGHTGTLDPAASGLMILLLGKGTKIALFVSGLAKCYCASIQLGQVSDTGDAEGHLSEAGDLSNVTRERVDAVLQSLHGDIALRIPAYAAVHTNGKRRYELARAGQTVPPMERIASIFSTGLLAFGKPAITIRVHCATGTYIRSLAETIGEMLGCGAFLAGLRREEVGQWHVDDAITIHDLESLDRNGDRSAALRAIEEFLPFPKVRVQGEFMPSIVMGRPITPAAISNIEGHFAIGDPVTVCDAVGHAIAMVTARFDSPQWPDRLPTGELFTYRRVLVS